MYPCALQIHMFPCLQSNYAYLLHDPYSGRTACIDTPDSDLIWTHLQKKGWHLTDIFNTHYHRDHTGGNIELKQRSGCQIIGPRLEANRIPAMDQGVSEGDQIIFGDTVIDVYHTPGHTHGHIIYYISALNVAFVGDVIFSMGCGRLEGKAQQMWHSLKKISQWPDHTQIYCAHEYSQENARFAISLEPNNPDIQARTNEVNQLRQQNKPTIPTTVGLEKKTNPFLRITNQEIIKSLNLYNLSEDQAFARIRKHKDLFL